MSKPAFSVIMPVYQVERFVAEAVQSVLDQTFGDFELIIVDDGGSDRSMAICETFTDPRIRIVSQPNRGLAGARNTGIAQARGRYVALLDSDDRWARDKLMLHFVHLEASPDVDVSYAGSRLIDAAGRPMRVAMRPKLHGIGPADILMRNPVGNGSAPVIRMTALNICEFCHPGDASRPCWFDESFRQSEDIEMWLRMSSRHGLRFEGIEGLLTDYRVVAGGLSAQIPRQFETWRRAVSGMADDMPAVIGKLNRRATAYQLRYLARRAVQLGDGPFAMSLIGQALRASPRILLSEPRKTVVTIAGAIAARYMPTALLQRLMARHIGSEQPG